MLQIIGMVPIYKLLMPPAPGLTSLMRLDFVPVITPYFEQVKKCLVVLFLLAVHCCSLLALDFKIESPDKGEVWVKSEMTKNSVRWNERDQSFYAEVTYSNSNYGGNGNPSESESFDFKIPGVTYDPAAKIFYVTAPSGEKVAFAQRTKAFLGSRIDLYKIATIHVACIHGNLSIALAVDTKAPVDTPVKTNPDGTISVPLQSIIGH